MQCNDISQAQSALTDLSIVGDIVGANSSSNVLPQTSLRLASVDVAALIPSSVAYTSLARGFAKDMAASLGVDESEIQVKDIVAVQSGRRMQQQLTSDAAVDVNVVFVITSVDVMSVLYELEHQLEDPLSPLLNSPTTGTIVANETLSYAFVCPAGTMRAVGATQCSACPGNEVPNDDQSACSVCPAGTTSSSDSTRCVCEQGLYNIADLPIIQCFDMGFVKGADPLPSATGCYTCPTSPSCLTCPMAGTGVVTLKEGYSFAAPSLSQIRHAFKCPTTSACPAQTLQVDESAPWNGTTGVQLIAQNCSRGHTGLLCAKCLDGWKMSPVETCQPCTATTSWLQPLLLIPMAVAAVYMGFRKLLTFKRHNRRKKLGAAENLFKDMVRANLFLSPPPPRKSTFDDVDMRDVIYHRRI